jgi:hypothetical protein
LSHKGKKGGCQSTPAAVDRAVVVSLLLPVWCRSVSSTSPLITIVPERLASTIFSESQVDAKS